MSAVTPMDDEYVQSIAKAALAAGAQLIDLIGMDAGKSKAELLQVAQDLAEVLRDILDFIPDRSDEDNQLAGALERWL